MKQACLEVVRAWQFSLNVFIFFADGFFVAVECWRVEVILHGQDG